MTEQDTFFMTRAIELAKMGVEMNLGGPFGCVVAKNGVIVGEGNNQVTSTNDPTAHAEVIAIREACKTLGSFQLEGCTIYTSCEPCPMCLGAITGPDLNEFFSHVPVTMPPPLGLTTTLFTMNSRKPTRNARWFC